MGKAANVMFIASGLASAMGTPLVAQTSNGSAEPSNVEVSVGGDLAFGRDIVVASAVAGVRGWGSRVGPWLRLAHVSLGVVCPIGGTSCESDAWSVATGFTVGLAD
jgi:hypothetical protein